MEEHSIDVLFEMLKYMRPHNSDTEHEFIRDFIDPVQGMQRDSFGNRYIKIGEKPTTMWSCHVDTVHKQHGYQGIIYHKDCLIVERDDRDGLNTPLGADDAVGVWILLNMIAHGIPGLYIFHRGEEKGGLGSDHIVTNTPELVKGITHAIAFDRAGDSDIITWQLSGRCCSDQFAVALSERLLHRNFRLDPCDMGIFTDTANYTHLIPECTNISVGYYDEHTPNECVDLFYLSSLMDAILRADWKNLPTYRIATDNDYKDDHKWNKVKPRTHYYPANKSNNWLGYEDLRTLYQSGGAELLIQMLIDIGATEHDADTAWDHINDIYSRYHMNN